MLIYYIQQKMFKSILIYYYLLIPCSRNNIVREHANLLGNIKSTWISHEVVCMNSRKKYFLSKENTDIDGLNRQDFSSSAIILFF